jgi:hypothetical protein
MTEVAAPATPPSGEAHLYVKSDGQLYWKDDAGNEWAAGGGAVALDDLSDVNITSLTNGQFLMYDGTEWVNDAVTGVDALDEIGDVNASSPSDGQVLTWDATPGEWVAATPSAGGGGGSVLEEPNFGDSTGWTNVGATPTVQFGTPVADHLYITKTPPNTTTDAYFGCYRAWTPSAGQKRRVMVRAWTLTGSTQAVGMFVGNISSGKALLWEAYNAGPSRYHWRAMSSGTGSVNDADTSVQAGLHGVSGHAGIFGPFWLEIEYTSATSYQLRYSHDGFTYKTLVTNKAPDSAFTPDCWGVHVYGYGSTTPMVGLFQRWEEL